ncbi:hypothetical protein K4K58_013232 [Colletotrichum sp. SAR11_239]|nr:hypothetical protein K4K58_013232 [Colletotrichum sp. SAR11_239]
MADSSDSTLALPRPSPSPSINTAATTESASDSDADTNVSGNTPKHTTLRFTVSLQREFLRDSNYDAVQDANGTGPGPAAEDTANASLNLQTVNMTFDPNFSPSPFGPLNIRLRDNGTVAYVYAHTPDNDIDPNNIDFCIVKETIPLFSSPSRPPRCSFWLSPPSSLSRLWLLILWLVTIVATALLIISFNASGTYPPSSPSRSGSPTAPSRVRQAPLRVFDDLISLLQHHAVAPLPVVGSAQDIVDRHYRIHPNPREILTGNMTVADFFNHLNTASSELCAAVKAWSSRSRPSLHADAVLLCRDVSRSTLNVGPRWYQAAATLTSSWHSTSTYAIFHLLEALKDRLPLHNDDRYKDNATTSRDQDFRFYNETSHSVLHTISTLFFEAPELRGRPSSFAQAVYTAADDLDSLQHTVARAVISLSLLVNILRSDVVLDARAQKLRNDTRDSTSGWRFAGPSSARLNATELALARIIPPYDQLLPLLDTTSALTWAIGFSRQLLGTVVSELHAQGNRTAALLGTPLLDVQQADDMACWWRGGPWVTETWEQAGGWRQVLTRTHWYIPALGPTITQLQGLANWGTNNARRSQSQRQWWWAESMRRGARSHQ